MGSQKHEENNQLNIHFLVSKVREQQAEIETLKAALLRILSNGDTPTLIQRMCHEGLEKST